MQGKTISFHSQWQSKLELERRFIYLFIFKNKIAILRVELLIQYFHNILI